MTAMHDDGEVGFEEGMLWLPSHVLDEACGTKECTRNPYQKVQNHQQMRQLGPQKSPGEPKWPENAGQKLPMVDQECELFSWDPRKDPVALAYSYHKEQAQTSNQATGQNFNMKQHGQSQSCAPVILPARVVQALNLNVHALGVQVSPPQVQRYNPLICREACNKNSLEKRSDQKDTSNQCSFISQKRSSSPEIFLPKEWTY
ncbi:uncharacterized protein HKW66_Vig0250480 [Vigna angularis]|uniref:Uncharacterized protein n=1 Tax=Phaseolus angularis TaxID=3914 RepID=A0A8T0KV03_PHAAN|nr:uncharacterized protein HKW66_Vig0250480 [Vigna angularis]